MSVNNLIDNYHQRITVTIEYQIPGFVKWILFFILFLSMLALGYYLGISGKSYYKLSILFSLIFALVMFLIMVLDHPETGWVQVNQKPIITLQKQLE